MTYHVGYDPDTNNIFAGAVTKKGDRWTGKNVVNEECLAAVTNHFLGIARKEKTNEVGYRWTYDDGSAVTIKVVIENNPSEIVEKNDSQEQDGMASEPESSSEGT